MGKFSFILANVLGPLLMGCHDNSKAQAEQLAIMQARLDKQAPKPSATSPRKRRAAYA